MNAVQNPRVQNVRNPNGLIGVQGNGNQNQIGNGNLVAVRAEGNTAGHNGNQIRCYNCRGKEEAGIQLQAEEYDLMDAVADLDEIKEVNANCILMANLQQASSSGTQTDSTSVYDSDGSAEVHENCDNNEIFNMFTQEEQYSELLEPIPEPQQVPQNDNEFISAVTGVEQDGKIVEQHSANFEETHHGFVGYPFDYRVTLGFGSIAGGLDHVNHVIRLPLERGISLVLGLGDHPNCNTPKSESQRNVEYPRVLLHRSIAQDMRMTTKRVI
nr:hypothetical protein [Tanacetum cinerariifolium]